ncbi:MAG: exopolyphosphatase [bacterium]|nr:MAG: exopolyphosphatase [bacterium]
MFDPEEIEAVGRLLTVPQKIALISHKNPDGDTIGATLAMMHYLRKKGHEVTALVPNDFPAYYNWLPGADEMIVFDRDARAVRRALGTAQLLFCLDFNSLDRTGNMATDLIKFSGAKIVIDHHLDPSNEFDHYFSVVETSSTGELVFELIEAMGDKALLGQKVALALYTCIMTDTGSFSYNCNHGRTYHIVAALIDLGVDAAKVHKLIYDTYTENRLRLLGFALSSRLLVWNNLHTAVIHLNKDDLKRFDYQVGDAEGLVNYGLSLENVNLAVLLTERDNQIRISFRSKGNFSVNQLARDYFDGGGHKNAAGGSSKTGMENTLGKLKEVLQHYEEKLNYTVSL